MGNNKRKLLLTLLIVGVLGSIAAFGTYSAFVATTTNSGNSFAAGTVAIQEDGPGTALFNNVTNQGPGHTTERCIQVKYTGSLASTVHMFIPSTSNGSQFQVTVERGSGMNAGDLTNRTCSGFTASSTAVGPADDLSNFPSAYSGGVAGKASDAAWAQNDTVDYRIVLQPKDDATPNAHTSAVSTGSFSITWEAHSN